MAISTTLFLFLHTRDLNTRLREMEVRLQPDDVVSANQIISGKTNYSLLHNHNNNKQVITVLSKVVVQQQMNLRTHHMNES